LAKAWLERCLSAIKLQSTTIVFVVILRGRCGLFQTETLPGIKTSGTVISNSEYPKIKLSQYPITLTGSLQMG
jgi:hypothetical protein